MSWKQKYDILENECLGKGNFGAVYLAKRKNQDTRICVKLIKQKKQFGQHVLETKALNEFEIANQIKGKQFINLVNIYDVYQEDQNEFAYIFMEKCEGNILDFLRKNNQQTMNDIHIDELIRQISSGYSELSVIKIIHRDLKPENILYNLDVFGKPIFKLADFGLGKIVEELSIEMTQSVGTPYYRAPEVMVEEKYDNRCDLYSLGVIIYQMIVGEEKFNNEFQNYVQIQEKLINKKFSQIIQLPLSTFQQNYTDLLDSLINFNPNQRKSWQDLTQWAKQSQSSQQSQSKYDDDDFQRPRNNTYSYPNQQKQFKKAQTLNIDEQQESLPTSGRNSINLQFNQQNSNFQNVGSPLQNKFQSQAQVIPEFNLQQQPKQNIANNNFPFNNQFQSGQPTTNFQQNTRFQTQTNNNQTNQLQQVQPSTNVQQNSMIQNQINNNQAQNTNQFQQVQPSTNVRFQTQTNNNQTQNTNQFQFGQPTTIIQQNQRLQTQTKNNQTQNTNQFQQVQPLTNIRFQTQTNNNQTQNQNQFQQVQPSINVQQNSLIQNQTNNNQTYNTNQFPVEQPTVQSQQKINFQSNPQNNLSQKNQISKQGFSNVKFYPQQNPIPIIPSNPISQQNQNPQPEQTQNSNFKQSQNQQSDNNSNNHSASTSGQISQEIGK